MFKIVRSGIFTSVMVFLGFTAPVWTAQAQRVDLGNGWGPSPLEIAKLPDYCKRFFLEKKLPPNCDGVHHLCAGKVLINRSMNYSIPKRERQRIIGQAKIEVDYIFKRDNRTCPMAMMQDARATRGNVQMMENILR